MNQFNRFLICFCDVLGFENQFKSLGLDGILEKYEQLIQVIEEVNERNEHFFGKFNFKEGGYWLKEADVMIGSKQFGAYASDSVLLFGHADFPANRYPEMLETTQEERERRKNDVATGWQYRAIPCDNFLIACNELMCQSVEIGFPLRGALSLGECAINPQLPIFLGQPFIDAARLEKEQKYIGIGFTKSFMDEIVPDHFKIAFEAHMKKPVGHFSGFVLDWPRHWRKTRTESATEAVKKLDTAPEYSDYYKNTLQLIQASESEKRGDEGDEFEMFTSIRKNYPQFASRSTELHARFAMVLEK